MSLLSRINRLSDRVGSELARRASSSQPMRTATVSLTEQMGFSPCRSRGIRRFMRMSPPT